MNRANLPMPLLPEPPPNTRYGLWQRTPEQVKALARAEAEASERQAIFETERQRRRREYGEF